MNDYVIHELKMTLEGVLEREARDTRTVRELTHASLCISPPKMSMLLVRSNSADPLPLRFSDNNNADAARDNRKSKSIFEVHCA